MSEIGERRNLSVERVDLTTLVDICVQDGTLSPFQAESANVSGRGMHVRTSYLPEIGEDLVCRFEHDGTEVLVEGRVAWRAEGQDSGEFGIQFTALDACSAEILRGLGEAHRPLTSQSAQKRLLVPRLFSLEEDEPNDENWVSSGDKVRLHIDGLAGPMKACVQDGTERKVRVGSSLEFLKVGRTLKIEDVDGGQSRGAHVDSVNVVLNPSTSVPELVVMLRYEGFSPTPPPAVASQKVRSAPVAKRADAPDYEDGHDDEDYDPHGALAERFKPAAEAIRARLDGVLGSAGRVAGQAGGLLSRAATGAQAQLARMSKPAAVPRTTKHTTPGERRPVAAPRRTTAPPAHRRSSLADAGVVQRDPQQARDSRASMRPQTQTVRPLASPDSKKSRLLALGAFSLVALGGSALLLRGLSSGEEMPAPSVAAVASNAAPAPAPAAAAAQPAPPGGIVADVPLFGPKAMATSEAASAAAPELSDAQSERLAAAAAVDDEAWSEDAPESAPEKAVEVAPWGRGKLHLPTIHRVRLDGVGTEIAGAVESNGFTVVIPGRKAMESGRAIEKRDRRISQAKASNTARGASIHFEFRGGVPGYRVRIRKDFVEFLISAPEEGVATR